MFMDNYVTCYYGKVNGVLIATPSQLLFSNKSPLKKRKPINSINYKTLYIYICLPAAQANTHLESPLSPLDVHVSLHLLHP